MPVRSKRQPKPPYLRYDRGSSCPFCESLYHWHHPAEPGHWWIDAIIECDHCFATITYREVMRR